jgi:hypothetical protein
MTKMIDKHELLEDHIFGSGALSYPWWFDVQRPVSSESVYVTSEQGVHTVTASKVRSAFVKLVMDGFPALKGTDLADPDIDAEMADCILQQACFGEVIYG